MFLNVGVVNHKRSKIASKKPVGRHHACTHPGESTEYKEKELGVMPDV